jgi:hypothetical protein
MSEDRGTLEALADELTVLLSPLTSLTPANAPIFLAQLGILIDETQVTTIAAALTKVTIAISSLIDLDAELNASIDIGNSGVVVSQRVGVLNQVAEVISAFDQLKTALASLGLPGAAPIIDDLPKRLFDLLLARYLERGRSALPMLEFGGILERTDHNVGLFDPDKPFYTTNKFHLERISGWLADPKAQLADLYDWGKPSFDGKKLLAVFDRLAVEFGLPALYDSSLSPPLLDLVFLKMWPRVDLTPVGIELQAAHGLSKGSVELGTQRWTATLALDANVLSDTSILIAPGRITVQPPEATKLIGKIGAVYSFIRGAPDPLVLLSFLGAGRVTIEEVAALVELRFDANGVGQLVLGADLKGGKIRIGTERADGFVGKLLSGLQVESNFDLGIDYSLSDGLHFRGSSALEVQLASHFDLGPLSINALNLSVGIKDGAFPIAITADFEASLGPLIAVVQGIGFKVDVVLAPDNKGNLGPVDLQPGFVAPKGVGLSLDVGIIKGGGFLSIDVDKGEYFGAMELDFLGIISLKAIAIINTKMPDGSSGFSLLVIITADFPPIQLGFGFTLNAVGGLLGLNRTVNIEALREGVRTNAIKSVLFPQDVIANITRIVSDLKQIFPPLDDHFIVGPMAELGWGTPSIITLELGILIEIPVPRIAILGVLAAFLPAEELALLRIQVNFLGVIDFENKYISFDASLFDSRLLIYTLTGDMAFRLSWGDNPMFILSVGGFHPAYHDAPQDLQHMTRLGISLLSGDNPRISVMSYFAVTSNTVQFGARAELYAEAAGFNVYGFIGYDVLFQFDPFKFIASFEAGLALREGTETIMGIHLAGQLSGINPWNARGEASITILFLEVSVSFDETWGDSADKIDPPKEDIVARLTAEINDDRNWRAEIPDSNNLHVSIRKMELPPDQIVIHPMGVLTFSERLVPLGLEITKFGNKVPLDAKRFDIKATDPGVLTQTVTEQFAPANFFDKNDSEKLSSPSFDRLASGFKVTGASSLVMPTAVNKSVEYELTYLREKRTQLFRADDYLMASHVFKASTKANAAAVSTLSYARNRISVNAPDAVAVAPPQYAVANVSDMRLAGPDLVAGSYTEAQQKYSALIAHRPELKDQVQVLAHHELNND